MVYIMYAETIHSFLPVDKQTNKHTNKPILHLPFHFLTANFTLPPSTDSSFMCSLTFKIGTYNFLSIYYLKYTCYMKHQLNLHHLKMLTYANTTSHKFPHQAILSILLLFCLSTIWTFFKVPGFQKHSIYVLHLTWQTKIQTHKKNNKKTITFTYYKPHIF
jgi:hypothetical protein